MVQIAFEVSEGTLSALHRDRVGFARDLRLAAAAKWYETGQVSQGRAAEIAGVSRAEFLDALARFGVTPFQVTADELVAEWQDA